MPNPEAPVSTDKKKRNPRKFGLRRRQNRPEDLPDPVVPSASAGPLQGLPVDDEDEFDDELGFEPDAWDDDADSLESLTRRPELSEEEAAQALADNDWSAYVSVSAPHGADGANEKSAPRSRLNVRLDPELAPKLHKVLADSGLGSRRDMEQMIIAGRVSVNGEPAHIGQRVLPTDIVKVNGRPVQRRNTSKPPRILIYHKPAGEIVSADDPEKRASVFDRLPRVSNGKWLAVGRLDFNTEGLLILTTSGEVANRLMHPRFEVEREYAVRILGELDDAGRQALLRGVELEDGVAKFAFIDYAGGDGANRWYRVGLSEGKNREVRRMFEALGLTVSRLIRVRFGDLLLPTTLRRGRWVEMEPLEALSYLQALGLRQSPAADGGRPTGKGGARGKPQRSAGRGGQPVDPKLALNTPTRQFLTVSGAAAAGFGGGSTRGGNAGNGSVGGGQRRGANGNRAEGGFRGATSTTGVAGHPSSGGRGPGKGGAGRAGGGAGRPGGFNGAAGGKSAAAGAAKPGGGQRRRGQGGAAASGGGQPGGAAPQRAGGSPGGNRRSRSRLKND